MGRKRRMSFGEERDTNKIFIIAFSVLLIAILAFVVTFVLYRNYLNNQAEIAEHKILEIADLTNNNETQSSEASSSIGKTVNEMQQTDSEIGNTTNTEKISINTSNMVKENIQSEEGTSTTSNVATENIEENLVTETVAKENLNNEINANTANTANAASTNTNATKAKEQTIKKEEKVPDPTFKKPVEGEITNEFAKDTLIYSNTLQEWVTHYGIDIKADKTTIVKASADGTVKSIKNDPRYGITVVIEHVNGFSSVYSNLLTAEFITEGEKVEQGQTIATVGNTATFEIADGAHLHFEIMKNGENVDPELYLK